MKYLKNIKRKVRLQRECQIYKRFYKGHVEDSSGSKRILMYVGIGSMYLTPFEISIYHLLQQKGYQVDYYIYDDKITINEVITKDRYEQEGSEKFWRRAYKDAIQKLKASKVEYKFINERVEVNNIVDGRAWQLSELLNFSFEGINFGHIVEGSLYRFYKSLKFDDDSIKYGKEFLRTSLINYFQIKEILRTSNYEAILFSHGIYCTWQPVVNLLTQKGIDYICYDRGKTKGHININLNNPSPVWDISEAWKRYADRELTAEELGMVDQYLKERELQKGDVYAYNFASKADDLNHLRQSLKIKPGAKVICVFTNLIWDAANVARDVAFLSPLKCIQKTINHYKAHNDVHVLIRTHPAERVLGTKETYGALIRNSLDSIPENVTIVEPDMEINSFSILELADIGVVHTSTVGLEMAIEGKPVILISDTHYRNKGFTFDAGSEAEYFQFLNEQLQHPKLKPRQVELAKKYFYLMMFHYQKKMPVLYNAAGAFQGYAYDNFHLMRDDEQSNINLFIADIVNGVPLKDFIRW
ncbi:hypothetical protein GCM10009122_56050 [Fulvivirga kasyanovii]|uniref:Capsule polysaccharide biosynthesis protein n=1 Tax=Fulvivirga kasyanovii TaxID=396812 RepID=A0ABW9RKL1_9BACT|nr:hypothetical protein [Fulvivirga kasyanovii]MTI24629.1 hypothetical protein [Fulvivirga kasyanovii]